MADRPDALTAQASAAPARRTPPLPAWAFAAALTGIAAAELAWLAWYWTVPLPNAQAAQTTLPDGTTRDVPLQRWYLLAQAVPFVPGTSWNETLLGHVTRQLGRIDYLYQRVSIAAAGLWVAAGGMGLGFVLLRWMRLSARLPAWHRAVFAFGLGMTGLGVLTLAFGRIGWLSPWAVRAGLTVFALSGVAQGFWFRGAGPSAHAMRFSPLALLPLPFLVLMVLGSMQPSLEFDSLEYHLQGPKEWFLAGKIMFLPHNVYTTMPFGVEMLHLLGMYAIGDWWHGALAGQFVVMLHTLVAALAIGLAAARLGSPRAGWVAALVYLSTPWAYRLSVFSWVEGPLVFYHAALVLAVLEAWPKGQGGPGDWRLWGLAGALAGGAMACKYPALLTAVIPAAVAAALVAWRGRSWRVAAAFLAGLALTIGPWLAKNVIDHGNPVYPLANSVFHGHPWSERREAQWRRAHSPRAITWGELATGVLDVAGRNDWQSPLFVALAPLALLRRESRRTAILLWVYVAYIFITWWLFTHRLDRFWLPLLAPLAVLAGLGADWTRRVAWTLLLGVILACGLVSTWFFDTTDLAGLSRWTDDLNVLRRDVPRLASPTLAWLDEALPPGAKVLLVGQAGVFHLKHEHIYNTVFDEESLETLARGRTPRQVHAALKERGVTHILVDWSEIARHRKPGGYGFSEFITPELFESLRSAGVLVPLPCPLPEKSYYAVAGP